MSGTRLVPQPNGAFPYDEAVRALREVPAMELEPLNFDPIIERGQRTGMSADAIDAHRELRERGLCFTFRQNVPPWLRGTLYEDNVFFEYDDEKQEAALRPAILGIAARLGLKVIEY